MLPVQIPASFKKKKSHANVEKHSRNIDKSTAQSEYAHEFHSQIGLVVPEFQAFAKKQNEVLTMKANDENKWRREIAELKDNIKN